MSKKLRPFWKGGNKLPLGIKLVALVILFRYLGWGMIDPYYSIFVSSFTENYTRVGLLIGLPSLVSLFMALPLVRLASRVQDARLMEDGEILYFFAMVCYVLAGLLHSLPFLIIAFIFTGFAHPLVITGAEAYIRRHDSSKRGTSTFAYYTALAYFGWILGMVISAFSIQFYGFTFMFFSLVPSIICGLLVLPKIHERGIRSLFSGFRRYFHRKEDLNAIMSDLESLDHKSFFFLLLSFFDGVLLMYFLVFIPLFALSINLSLRQTALLMAVVYIPFVFSFLFSYITRHIRRMDVIAMGLFIGGLAFTLLAVVVEQLWVVLLIAISSLAIAIIRPAYNGMLTHLTPRRMLGEITGINNLAMRLGYVIGPVFSGFIADLYGLNAAFFVIAFFSFGLGVLTLFLRGYEQLVSEQPDLPIVHYEMEPE